MFSRVVLAGFVVAGCVLAGSPASASVSAQYSCSGLSESRYGVTIKCDYPKWQLRINCTLIGPLVGPDAVAVSPEIYGSNVAGAWCPPNYYYEVSKHRYYVNRIW